MEPRLNSASSSRLKARVMCIRVPWNSGTLDGSVGA